MPLPSSRPVELVRHPGSAVQTQKVLSQMGRCGFHPGLKFYSAEYFAPHGVFFVLELCSVYFQIFLPKLSTIFFLALLCIF